MKTKLIILGVSVALLIFALLTSNPNNLKPRTVFKRGTVIGTLNLSNVPWETGHALLVSSLNNPIYLNLEASSRGVTPQEMGVGLDRDKLSKLTKTCRTSFLKLFCKNTSNEKIDPNSVVAVDEEKIGTFLSNLESQVQYLSGNTIISFDDYSFRSVAPNTPITLNAKKLLEEHGIANLITAENLSLQLYMDTNEDKKAQHKATEDTILNITKPLLIKYGRNPIYIPTDILTTFISKQETDGFLYGIIEKKPIKQYLSSLKDTYGSDEVVILLDESVNAIKKVMLFRASDYEINNAVVLPLEGKPVTQGELHKSYIEVVKSQQRTYRFEDGELTKTYIISTGLTWETPPGTYQVLGKQRMTISYFGNWYMPYYLPVGTVNGYRFGFHEIPYHMDGAGNIYSRDPNTMGSPATGGCIQLTNIDAMELFAWAEVGTPVYIYE